MENKSIDKTILCENLAGGIKLDKVKINFEPIQIVALTIKPCYKSYQKKSQEDIGFLVDKYIELLNPNSFVALDNTIEYDTHGVPHIHATIATIYENPRTICKGWHIYFVKVLNPEKWYNYIHKEELKDDYCFINE